MCGLIGTFSFDGLTDDELASTAPLTALLKRRGPDDERFWTDGKYCSFGFRRLAILDLTSAANQPMVSSDSNFVLLINGEIYNFQELRKELIALGFRFESSGDSEVALYALIAWGKKAFERFNGMFAIAFFDIRNRRLLLARDHAGIKPLYYLLGRSGIVFSSQYDSLMAHPWAKDLRISTDALALYFRFGFIHAPYALLENTHMLEPGTWLEIEGSGKAVPGRFFEFPMFSKPELSGEQAFEAVDAAITSAVRRQMISDVPAGAFLSGGIDSPLIVSRMRAVSGAPFPTFTLGADHDRVDESEDAKAYANHLGVENTIEHMTPSVAEDMLSDVISACGEPFSDYSIFPTMFISRLARTKVKVLLSGDGGDELFWGYWERVSEVMNKLRVFQKPYWYRRTRQILERHMRLGHGFAGHQSRTIGHYYRRIHSKLPENFVRRIFPGGEFPSGFKLFDFSGVGSDETANWIRWNEFTGFLSMVLLKVDRGSMFHSVEVRVPFLDREVLDVALRINWESCIDMKNGLGKLPLRHALSRSVSFQTQTKRGFTVPMDKWLKGMFRPIFQDMVLGRKEILGHQWDCEAIQELFDAHLNGQKSHTWGLWLLLSLALWEDRHFKNRSTVLERVPH